MVQYSLHNLRFLVQTDYDLEEQISRKLKLPRADFALQQILRKAVDTRRKNHPVYDFTVQLAFSGQAPRHADLAVLKPAPEVSNPDIPCSDAHPFIIGMGPAGLFCALAMVENGLQPWLFDQGDALETRTAKVESFWKDGLLDEESNIQFGEGGAGAFSDGKLTCRSNNPDLQKVLGELVRFGAPEEINYSALPHLGTDGIRKVIRNIRDYLSSKGCQFHYRSKLQDLEVTAGRLTRVNICGEWQRPELLVLGLGNSARSTFKLLQQRGLPLEAKAFAVGFRIEHQQAQIDRLVYGGEQWADILGPASYRLTSPAGFTFCMCPGGTVIGASSERDSVVTNGMSFAQRSNPRCNSAIVSPVTAVDYGTGLWAGLALQSQIEKAAFREGYLAPAQTALAYLKGALDKNDLQSSYRPGIYSYELSKLYSTGITERLRSALHSFDGIFRGFSANAVLVAPETRTSSPVRILRDRTTLASLGAANLYPIGEGSGYAGGIVSSAVDGLRLGKRLKLESKS